MNKISHDSETAADGKQVFTACAFIHEIIGGEQKVFLPKRAKTKKFLPDVFELPGGHIDYGEDMVDGLKREVTEEFGMRIKVGEPFFVFTYTNEIKGSHSIEVIYFAKFIDSLDNIIVNPEDHSEYGWFSADELEKAYTDSKGGDDIEFMAIKRGFEILNDAQLLFE